MSTVRDQHIRNCVLAFAYGRRIVAGNAIDGHYEYRRALVAKLAEQEVSNAEAVVPIPNAGLYLASCWAELRTETLWHAFGDHQAGVSMFRLSDLKDRRQRAQSKVGEIKNPRHVNSVVLIDEACLTGFTMSFAIRSLRAAGVSEVHARVLLPPIARACPYGVLGGTAKAALQLRRPSSGERQRWAAYLGATDFDYLDSTELPRPSDRNHLCTECLARSSRD